MSEGKLRAMKRVVSTFTILATALGALTAEPAPVLAKDFNNFVGGFVGGVIGGFVGGMMRPQHWNNGSRQPKRSTNNGGGGSSPTNPADPVNPLAALAPPTSADQAIILKAIVPVAALGSVGSTNELERAGQDDFEGERDYTSMVEDLVARLNTRVDDKGSGSKPSATSDITQHAVLEALDDAIRNSLLIKFETFRDESWSPERLRVMVLDRLNLELGDALDSKHQIGLTMHDLEVDIGKAVKSVQTRLFETSELLAANRNSTNFLLRLYQTHGDVSSETRERTERVLRQAANDAVATMAPLFQRDANGYALHYRGERIVYDCLTENVEAITSAESGVASDAEIEQRILDTDSKTCAKWVADQLVGPDGALKPQEPVPLRVTWSSAGPSNDDTLFTRAPDEP